ncbi:MAG TPA: FecR family protein, partial [Nitrospirota bacterium]
MRLLNKYGFFVFILLLLYPALAFSNDSGLIRLSLIDGDVQVMIKDITDWTPATINLPLYEGDRVWTAEDSKAELQIRGGVYVRADGNTALDILSIAPDSAQFYLDRGHLYINNRRGGIRTVQVDTPQSSIRSYDNSIMLVDVTEDGMVEVSVLKGYAYAENREGATRVSAGNTLAIRGEDYADLAPIASPDEWEQWNTDRDRRLTAWGESSRYLPDELHEYSSDFDENGRWVYASAYGYVWTPTAVAAGWSPYSVGSWVWIRGNYVWISYDPWCWAPSHYGRWVSIASLGWSWVPPTAGAVYWGPGYVGWVVTPSYVAWVPLAPGETYYGYGYYGPWSRNISTVNVNTVVVNRRYINAGVNNSVVVVQRDTFGTGRRIPAKIAENPFTQPVQRSTANIAVVPPQVKPRQPIVIMPSEERERMRRQITERERAPREVQQPRQPAQPAMPQRPGAAP